MFIVCTSVVLGNEVLVDYTHQFCSNIHGTIHTKFMGFSKVNCLVGNFLSLINKLTLGRKTTYVIRKERRMWFDNTSYVGHHMIKLGTH